MSVNLECIGCREVKSFENEEKYPVCKDCKTWEEQRLLSINDCPPESFLGRLFKKSNKKPIPNHIRWAVWERDNFTCKNCGTRRNLSVDHIFPESKGGEATLENCQTLCVTCNSRKGAR